MSIKNIASSMLGKEFIARMQGLFEENAEKEVDNLKGYASLGNKISQLTMMVNNYLINESNEQQVSIMAFPEGMPQTDKQKIFMGLGIKLYQHHDELKKEQGFYFLYSTFLITEVWIAHYQEGVNDRNIPPSEREDKKEYFIVYGRTFSHDQFLCQVELKRYKDHILAGNEIERVFQWHNKKEPQQGKLNCYPLQWLFEGYGMAMLSKHK